MILINIFNDDNSLQDFWKTNFLNQLAFQQTMKALRILTKILIPVNYFVEVCQSTEFDVWPSKTFKVFIRRKLSYIYKYIYIWLIHTLILTRFSYRTLPIFLSI